MDLLKLIEVMLNDIIMKNNVITLDELIRILRLEKFNQNDFIFFQELVEKIIYLTQNKLIYRTGVVFFGRKLVVINNKCLVLHFAHGVFDYLEYKDRCGDIQTFNRSSFIKFSVLEKPDRTLNVK